MKIITKDNGDLIMHSEQDEEIDENSLLIEEGGQEKLVDSLGNDVTNNLNEKLLNEAFNITFGDEIELTLWFGKLGKKQTNKKDNIFIGEEKFPGILHSFTEELLENTSKQIFEYWISQKDSIDYIKRIKKLMVAKHQHYEYCISHSLTTTKQVEFGKIISYYMSNILDGKVLFKIVLIKQ